MNPNCFRAASGMLFVGLLAGGLLAVPVEAQEVQVSETYTSPNAQEYGGFGRAVSAVGDVTGDGMQDLAAGTIESPDGKKYAGQIYLIDGADNTVVWSLTAPSPEKAGKFGSYISGVGDVSGDGTPDLLVGEPARDPDGTKEAGRAYVIDGAEGTVLRTLTSPNAQESGFFGWTVLGIWDVSGDDTPDLLIGTRENPEDKEDAGRVYLFDGADGSVLRTVTSPNPQSDGTFGESASRIEDVSGDGTPDLLVGSGENAEGTDDAGRVYMVDGANGKVLRSFTSANPGYSGGFGRAVLDVGDVSGDGTPDVMVGAPFEKVEGNRDAGRMYVIDGATGDVLQTLTSPNPQKAGHFGKAMSTVGDVSGDGTPDVLVGERGGNPGDVEYAGQAYLIDPANGTVLQAISSPNVQDRGHFGRAVSVMGTDEGTPDLLVGAPRERSGGADGAGRLYRFTVVPSN